MGKHKHINQEWMENLLHTRDDRKRFADALSGPDAVASRSHKGEKNGAADSKGGEPVYYVYGLFDKAQWEEEGIYIPFYIGKGSGQRVFSHGAEAVQHWKKKYKRKLTKEVKGLIEDIKDANEKENKEKANKEEDQKTRSKKCERILDCEKGIIEGVFKFGLYEDEAFCVEDALIKAYNLINEDALIKAYNLIKTDPRSMQADMPDKQLLLTNAVAGHSTAYEKSTIGASRDTILKLSDVLEEIALKPMDLKEIRQKLGATRLLIIKIDEGAYRDAVDAVQRYKDKEDKLKEWIRNRSRGYWNVKPEKGDYAVIVLKGSGRILDVYEITEFDDSGRYWIDLRSPAKGISEKDYSDAPWQWQGDESDKKRFQDLLGTLHGATSKEKLKEIKEQLKNEFDLKLDEREHWKFYRFKDLDDDLKKDITEGKRIVVCLRESGESSESLFRTDTARAVSFWDEEVEKAWECAYAALGNRIFEENTKTNQTHKPKLHLQELNNKEKKEIATQGGTVKTDKSNLGKWLVEFPNRS